MQDSSESYLVGSVGASASIFDYGGDDATPGHGQLMFNSIPANHSYDDMSSNQPGDQDMRDWSNSHQYPHSTPHSPVGHSHRRLASGSSFGSDAVTAQTNNGFATMNHAFGQQTGPVPAVPLAFVPSQANVFQLQPQMLQWQQQQIQQQILQQQQQQLQQQQQQQQQQLQQQQQQQQQQFQHAVQARPVQLLPQQTNQTNQFVFNLESGSQRRTFPAYARHGSMPDITAGFTIKTEPNTPQGHSPRRRSANAASANNSPVHRGSKVHFNPYRSYLGVDGETSNDLSPGANTGGRTLGLSTEQQIKAAITNLVNNSNGGMSSNNSVGSGGASDTPPPQSQSKLRARTATAPQPFTFFSPLGASSVLPTVDDATPSEESAGHSPPTRFPGRPYPYIDTTHGRVVPGQGGSISMYTSPVPDSTPGSQAPSPTSHSCHVSPRSKSVPSTPVPTAARSLSTKETTVRFDILTQRRSSATSISTDVSALSAAGSKVKKLKNRNQHKEEEHRRRTRIRDGFSQLRIATDCSKKDRFTILRAAVAKLTSIDQHVRALEEERAQLRKALQQMKTDIAVGGGVDTSAKQASSTVVRGLTANATIGGVTALAPFSVHGEGGQGSSSAAASPVMSPQQPGASEEKLMRLATAAAANPACFPYSCSSIGTVDPCLVINVAIAYTSVTGQFLACNDNFLQLLGMSRDSLQTHSLFNVIHGEHLQPMCAVFQHFLFDSLSKADKGPALSWEADSVFLRAVSSPSAGGGSSRAATPSAGGLATPSTSSLTNTVANMQINEGGPTSTSPVTHTENVPVHVTICTGHMNHSNCSVVAPAAPPPLQLGGASSGVSQQLRSPQFFVLFVVPKALPPSQPTQTAPMAMTRSFSN